MKNTWLYIRTAIVKGFLLLLPVILVVFLIGKLWMLVHGIVLKFSHPLGINRPGGYLIAIAITTLVFLIVCLLAGFIANVAAVSKTKAWLENNVLRFMPGYYFIKTMFQEKLGDDAADTSAVVYIQGGWQPCLLIEEGDNGWNVVYVPMAPAFTSGRTYVVEKHKVKKINIPIDKMKDVVERFGKGLSKYAE
ncbi:hypothetical protein [Chitinophaga barathri]|uniref:DUF502 domain-containing protein n=1 Tax=Chitinophaga barathri TaxID=1647451 RepID=A0A3N4M885_9BACT|nr:hypothetical protein [Chitinophaga barathri]RPD39762.1 hypothetical protein EG028_19185 [Chitinophaga barathri]